jgi:NAD(P)H-flavin reductase
MAVPEGRFYPARLLGREDAGGGLAQVVIETTADTAMTYTSPGQYVEVRAEQQSGFFVLSNEPGGAAWELVMRSGSGASDVLLNLAPGASFEVTGAIGAGFPMVQAHGHPLIVALGGTGIAAGRPIVRRRVAEGDAARTQVFVGVRARNELPMRGELEGWMREGVEVLVCLSKPDGSIEGVRHAHGYVQDVLRSRAGAQAHVPSPLLLGGHIFAVGPASMVEALRALAPELGIALEDVHTNH